MSILIESLEKRLSELEILSIIEKDPNQVLIPDKKGNHAIHVAIINKVGSKVMKKIIKTELTCLQSVCSEGNLSNLPLHNAIKHENTEKIILLILESYPDATKIKNAYGFLPLHLAVISKLSAQISYKILCYHPIAASIVVRGELPIHRACNYNPILEVIEQLITAYPRGLQVPDLKGELPIHIICKKQNIKTQLYSLLIDSYCVGVNTKNRLSEWPIHILCSYFPTKESILLFILSYPDTLQYRNKTYALPIHAFLNSQINLSIDLQMKCITTLIKYYPNSLFESMSKPMKPSSSIDKTEKGEKIINIVRPIEIAMEKGYHSIVLRLLYNSMIYYMVSNGTILSENNSILSNSLFSHSILNETIGSMDESMITISPRIGNAILYYHLSDVDITQYRQLNWCSRKSAFRIVTYWKSYIWHIEMTEKYNLAKKGKEENDDKNDRNVSHANESIVDIIKRLRIAYMGDDRMIVKDRIMQSIIYYL